MKRAPRRRCLYLARRSIRTHDAKHSVPQCACSVLAQEAAALGLAQGDLGIPADEQLRVETVDRQDRLRALRQR